LQKLSNIRNLSFSLPLGFTFFTPFRVRKGGWCFPLSSIKQIDFQNCQKSKRVFEKYFCTQKSPAEKTPAGRVGNCFLLNGMCA